MASFMLTELDRGLAQWRNWLNSYAFGIRPITNFRLWPGPVCAKCKLRVG